MIDVRPFDDLGAYQIFAHLDPSDYLEAQLVRSEACTHLGLFSDWRAAEGARLVSFLLRTAPRAGAVPFAVCCLAHTGQAGVAAGAFLARNHATFGRPIAEAVAIIRRQLPQACRSMGIRRVEARCWAGHPTASHLLGLLGFAHECDMAGFGPAGAHTYRQFAIVFPTDQERI